MCGLMANCFAWIKRRKGPARSITLVIIGLDDAGKTTMVASLQGEPPEGITPTIGFANAELSISDFKVTVYDLGGGVRIRDVWRKYYSEVFGLVFVVDSTNGKRLEESKEVLHEVAKHEKITGKPFIVFANKQDKEGALQHNDIANILELEDLSTKLGFSFKVVSCSALKGYGRHIDKNISTGFQWLLSTISGDFSKISARVENDVQIQKEEDERERKARVERIRKIREERDRLEREAGNDPDKEDSDDDVMMNNPFQPIGKHLDNLKAKEKKKKGEKENKGKSVNSIAEDKPKEETPDAQIVKKKRKKKKAIKSTESDLTLQTIDSEPTIQSHLSVEPDRHNEISTDNEEEQVVEHQLVEDQTVEDQVVVRKKKKKKQKKPKVKKILEHVSDEGVQDVTNDLDVVEQLEEVDNHVTAPLKKKAKKKKKQFAALEEDNTTAANRNDFVVAGRYELEDLHNGVATLPETETVKKPKMKKKKKKRNRTVPLNTVGPEVVHKDALPPPAWKTQPSSWAALPPIGNNGDVNFAALPPLQKNNAIYSLNDSSLEKISTTQSFARARPNSEDYDIVT